MPRHLTRRGAALAVLGLLSLQLTGLPPNPVVSAADAAVDVAWVQVGDDIDGEAAGDESGRSVAMSSDGTTVVIGAVLNDGEVRDAGQARVFHLDDGVWVQVGGDIDGEEEFDFFGVSVAMSGDGNTVIVGAHFSDDNGSDSGRARVYRLVGNDWLQIGDDIVGEADNDYSGWSVAMSDDGDTVIVGAYGNDGNGSSSGHARIFHLDDGVWVQVGDDIDGEAETDVSGWSVAMSSDADTVIIGANFNGTSSAGHARIFHFDGESWVRVGGDINGEAASDLSGGAVAMSADGNTVIIGAAGNDANGNGSGHARVFHLDSGDWVQVGDDIDGEAALNFFGKSVAMSDDGTTVIIGADGNSGTGESSGHARVHRFDGTAWVQVGDDIDGEAEGDRSGRAVAMSADGNTVAIGAQYNDGNGEDSGHARVYVLGAPEVLVCGDIARTADELAAAGYNVVVGTDAADFLPGTTGNDFILGLDGKDVILAGMGDDVVCAGGSHDVVVGGGGADLLHGDGGNDKVWGGNQDDHISGGAGKDLLVGGNGDDDVSGDGADDMIRGGNDDDVLRGGSGRDDIRGDSGNDTLFGDAHDDVLRGHAGIDVCDGGAQVNGDQAFSCETVIDIP